MEIYLKKDVPRVGMAGQIIKVETGFANNYLIPQGFGVMINDANRETFKKKERKPKDPSAVSSETSLLAEKIGSLRLIVKRKTHDDGKLYAAIRPGEVADVLLEKGFKVDKNQVIFERPIKEKGSYKVIIKLSTKLQPQIHLDVLAE